MLDRFRLHREYKAEWSLVAAVASAVKLASDDLGWSTPVLLLAQEFEAFPEPWAEPALFELGNQLMGIRQTGLFGAVLKKDSAALYRIAAARALGSREVGRRSLGGRLGVFMAEDFSGVVAGSFVFKPTTRALADHERRRTVQICARIERSGDSARFEMATLLADAEVPAGDALRECGCEVVLAKRFHEGRNLTEALRKARPARKAVLLERTVDYLALIHLAIEDPGPQISHRKELKKKELGRWLNNLGFEGGQELFVRWWNQVADLPVVPRRDSHPYNWIVTAGESVVALDLEACGVRPVGYELAQLTDDELLLPADDTGWAERMALVRRYAAGLQAGGVKVTLDAVGKGFEAGLLARAVRALSDPSRDPRARSRGERLIQLVRNSSSDSATVGLAADLESAWRKTLAATDASSGTDQPTQSRRTHLSRAMAFQLRHGEEIANSAGGWLEIALLVDLLNRDGFRTSEGEVMAVAEALDEKRYEVLGTRVRALYGHTAPTVPEYAQVCRREDLFHGSAYENLDSILSDGLLPGKRQYVHLSSDIDTALKTARRHGPAVILRVSTSGLEAVYGAGGNVFLAKHVPPDNLRLVNPSELLLRDFSTLQEERRGGSR